ncbi:MAG: GNAT family N-acetyltransferase [Sandarakinorhabdus sp.]|nr:GNAT family N-acetyltransferase [Sandarakinorhabdus sp.]
MNHVIDWEIRTARTLVRPAVVGDVAALHASRGQMPFDPQTRTLAQRRRLVAAMDRRPPRDAAGWQQFAVLAGDGGGFLGDIGVNFDTPRNQQAEIGFAFAPAARGQGYAVEAVGAMVEYLFARGRHRLIAQTDMRNVATQKLLEKLRFRREAMHLQSWAEDGKWYDEVAYARLASE